MRRGLPSKPNSAATIRACVVPEDHGHDEAKRTLADAHLPSWFKAALREAARGKRSYLEVAWHLAFHHPDTFGLDRPDLPTIIDRDFRRPTAALRRLFASERHPAADLVDHIPVRRRHAFLRGVDYGLRGRAWSDVVEEDGPC